MRVKPQQVHRKPETTYTLWDGKVTVVAHQQWGIDGFETATITVNHGTGMRNDIRTEVWYKGDKSAYTPQEWIARQLTRLSFKQDNSTCEVEGLC